MSGTLGGEGRHEVGSREDLASTQELGLREAGTDGQKERDGGGGVNGMY